ncbi:monothiol glutaredoxin-S3-like [Dioscorea cayenensis subsp. rotundata]|uniref:Monothiol glutaredoxin-S3-like n=1 Tax=Dioscorea cayennensis subsp. rotundata TaxID=55577 RepID=A0AB40BNH2_DIOCR|nr:monothiol glutaredoxin-S3-like [Dioscorea cayenensis subsp. rotundata]
MEQLLMVAMEEEGPKQIVEGSIVVIVGKRGCYMSYVAQRLLEELKAYLRMCEVSLGFAAKTTLMHNIGKILSGDDKTLVAPLFPVVYIGGKLVESLDQLIAIHVFVELIPLLKTTGVIWL